MFFDNISVLSQYLFFYWHWMCAGSLLTHYLPFLKENDHHEESRSTVFWSALNHFSRKADRNKQRAKPTWERRNAQCNQWHLDWSWYPIGMNERRHLRAINEDNVRGSLRARAQCLSCSLKNKTKQSMLPESNARGFHPSCSYNTLILWG